MCKADGGKNQCADIRELIEHILSELNPMEEILHVERK